MMRKFLIYVFCFLGIALCFWGCELIGEVCDEKEKDPIRVEGKYISEDYIVETVQLADSIRFIKFRFTEYQLSPSVIVEFAAEDVCTSSQFYAELGIYANSDYSPQFYNRITHRRIIAWYPSVYPSKKDLFAVGNRNNGFAIQIKLPRASKEHHSPGWVEMGLELKFKGENDLEKDLEILKTELQFFEFRVDYVKF